MDEQFLFYWSLWLLFVIVFFFIDQEYLRHVFLSFILLSIISVPFSMLVFQLTINVNIIIWGMLSVVLLCLHKASMKLIFLSFVFACFYGGLLWWKMIAPVWFINFHGIELSATVCLFVLLLCDHYIDRSIILLLGSTIGNVIHDGMLVYMQLDKQIGHLEHYIYLHFSLLILLFIYAIKWIVAFVWFSIKEVS